MPGSRSSYFLLRCFVVHSEELLTVNWFKESVWARYVVLHKQGEDSVGVTMKFMVRMLDRITITEFRSIIADCGYLREKTSKVLLKRNFILDVGGSDRFKYLENVPFTGNRIVNYLFVPREQLGPIATDLRAWESEQSTDIDDPEDRPKPSAFKVAFRKMRAAIAEETENVKEKRQWSSQVKPVITIDGNIDDPETHKRKQRRLEDLARENSGEPIYFVESFN